MTDKTQNYKILRSNSLPNEENLAKFEEDGWELMQLLDRGGYVYAYLRRAKKGTNQ